METKAGDDKILTRPIANAGGFDKKPIEIPDRIEACLFVPEEENEVPTSNFELFNGDVKDRIALIENILLSKGKEYSRGGDRFSNFKIAARRLAITPERALIGMREKHEVSIMDIVDGLDTGNLPSFKLLEEKIGDSINYLILLEGLLKERLRKYQEDNKWRS